MENLYRLRLLGPVTVEREHAPHEATTSRKAQALLGYLACQGRPVARSHLAGFFWSETSDARARRNLTRELGQIAAALPGTIRGDYYTVQWRPNAATWVDTIAFTELMAVDYQARMVNAHAATQQSQASADFQFTERQGQPIDAQRIAAAVALCQGEFMDGVYLDHCPEFEMWLIQERELWRRLVTSALDQLIIFYALHHEDAQAQAYARRWLALEPCNEQAHRYLMLLLARNGERNAALTQYALCRRILAIELGVEPSVETAKLYEQLRARG